MFDFVSGFFLNPQPGPDEDLDVTFHQLQSMPLLKPREELLSSMRNICVVVCAITLLNLAVTLIVHLVLGGGGGGDGSGASGKKKYHYDTADLSGISFRLTHMIINFVLGLWGLHGCTNLIHTPPATVLDQVSGLRDLAIFGELQAGYQIWSIPAGCFLVREPSVMFCHHLGALTVSAISTFATFGFRHTTPFFLAMIEISSVPLAMVNMFKTTRGGWKKAYPAAHTISRASFAVSFLILRVYMWIPRMMHFLSLTVSTGWKSCTNGFCVASMVALTTCGVFLTLLQLLWAVKVVKMLPRFISVQIRGEKTAAGDD